MKKFETVLSVILILFLVGSFLFVSLTNARSIEYTQPVPGVATASEVTSANVVLLKPIFDDDLASITSITSDNTADFPAIGSYTVATKTLAVAGLNASDIRNMTVVYRYARFTGSWGPIDVFMLLIPVLVIILVVWLAVDGLRHGRRG